MGPAAQGGGWKRRDAAAAGCDGDSVVIGVTKASSTSRGGRCVRQDDVVIGVERVLSTSRGDRGVMLRRQGDDGAMPLKPTTVAAADSMRCGGRRREAKVVSGVMSLAASHGAMPREGDGAMPL